MKAYIALLSIMILFSTALYPATAASFSIFAYDSESNAPLQDAYVTISQGGNLIDSGVTDASGFFPAILVDGSEYRIRAEYYGKWDEKPNYVANSASSTQINLYLHS